MEAGMFSGKQYLREYHVKVVPMERAEAVAIDRMSDFESIILWTRSSNQRMGTDA
jgi:hypothetical protein